MGTGSTRQARPGTGHDRHAVSNGFGSSSPPGSSPEDPREGEAMSDMSKVEKAEAAREARASVASAQAGSSSAAVAAAMRRYLSAEQYHELKGEQHTSESRREPADQAE